MSSGYPGVQDLSRACPGRQVLAGGVGFLCFHQKLRLSFVFQTNSYVFEQVHDFLDQKNTSPSEPGSFSFFPPIMPSLLFTYIIILWSQLITKTTCVFFIICCAFCRGFVNSKVCPAGANFACRSSMFPECPAYNLPHLMKFRLNSASPYADMSKESFINSKDPFWFEPPLQTKKNMHECRQACIFIRTRIKNHHTCTCSCQEKTTLRKKPASSHEQGKGSAAEAAAFQFWKVWSNSDWLIIGPKSKS